MMRSWEEAVKFQFGNTSEEEEFFVSVPGVPDNDETDVESGHHMMQWCVYYGFEHLVGYSDSLVIGPT
jgi:hypothetical protein